MSSREWIIRAPEESAVRALMSDGCSRVLATLLAGRGITDPRQAEAFFRPKRLRFGDPMEMKGMAQAVTRIRSAVEHRERIAVYGDYDVDGVTATALLVSYLKGKGADVRCYIPQREGEGYGLNRGAVEALHRDGVLLLVTVDTGISAFDEADYAAELGMDLIVTDHHEPRGSIPRALAVVNPKQPDCPYPFKDLAGVGVAMKLAAALEGDQERIFAQYGDLVCLGTVADVVPLVEENRLIAARGLEAACAGERPGLRALTEVAGLPGVGLTATQLSFALAPRINAAGRMASAMDAYELLTCRDEDRARQLAEALDGYNRGRQKLEGSIFTEACAQAQGAEDPVLVVSGEGWHNGVIGIVASRLAELYGKPAVVISLDGDEGRASCRSFPGMNIHDALMSCAGLLERFGGHELAAGFSVRKENIGTLRKALNDYANSLPAPVKPALILDCELEDGEISIETARDLKALEPCGAENPEPLFYLMGVRIAGVTPLKEGRHLRLELTRGGRRFRAVAFNVAKTGSDFSPGDVADFAVSLDISRYGGRESLSVIVRDCAVSRIFREERCRYRNLRSSGEPLYDEQLPDRQEFAAVYRYLAGCGGAFRPDRAFCAILPSCPGFTYLKLLIILDVFAEMNLAVFETSGNTVTCRLIRGAKISLGDSALLRSLRRERA